MVSNLISNNVMGQYQLKQKDKEIQNLQAEETFLIKEKDKEINKALVLSQSVALQADTNKSKLDQYQGWFGLSAVFMGLKQLFTTSIWFIIGIGIVFLLLRAFAASNPIAGAIFSIFETMFSWVVNTVRLLAPKALKIANTVEKSVFNATSTTLSKIIDSVEVVKLKAESSGKEATIQDLLNEAEKTMNQEDKVLVEQIKKKMSWT